MAKSIVVLNGEFYAGENTKENKLIFSPDRKKAVLVDERRERYITQTVSWWNTSGERKLKRLEIIEVKEEAENVSIPKVQRERLPVQGLCRKG
jgi:hypothetical protein